MATWIETERERKKELAIGVEGWIEIGVERETTTEIEIVTDTTNTRRGAVEKANTGDTGEPVA